MAEAFGVFAGGASLAVVIVDKAIKLKKLLQNIKDAPVYIRRVQQELQITADTLNVLDELHRGEPASKTLALHSNISASCKLLLEELDILLSDVEKRLDRRRGVSWAAFKATLRQDQVRELTQRVDQFLKLLQLVNQTTLQEVFLSNGI